MVVILMGSDAGGTAALVAALAAQLGWRWTTTETVEELVTATARSLGRREHLITAARLLSDTEQQTVRAGQSGVRFLDLTSLPRDPGTILATLRREFGV